MMDILYVVRRGREGESQNGPLVGKRERQVIQREDGKTKKFNMQVWHDQETRGYAAVGQGLVRRNAQRWAGLEK